MWLGRSSKYRQQEKYKSSSGSDARAKERRGRPPLTMTKIGPNFGPKKEGRGQTRRGGCIDRHRGPSSRIWPLSPRCDRRPIPLPISRPSSRFEVRRHVTLPFKRGHRCNGWPHHTRPPPNEGTNRSLFVGFFGQWPLILAQKARKP